MNFQRFQSIQTRKTNIDTFESRVTDTRHILIEQSIRAVRVQLD